MVANNIAFLPSSVVFAYVRVFIYEEIVLYSALHTPYGSSCQSTLGARGDEQKDWKTVDKNRKI